MQPMTRPLWRLEDLLVVTYRPDELTRTLLRRWPTLTAELPTVHSSPVQFMHDAVALLERHGGIDAALFAQILVGRPLRRSQIMSVAAALGIDGAAIMSLTDDATTHVFRSPTVLDPKVVDTLEKLVLEHTRCSSDDPRREALSQDIERIAAQIRSRRPARAGDRVAGTILEYKVGSGAFGTVWRSHEESTGAPRATKIFDPARLTDGIMLWRFRRSFRALEALNKYRGAPDSIPRIFAVADDGLAFAMEYFPGDGLERVAERPWTLEQKIEVFCNICRAIAFAHRAGVVHRDIKPNNVMFRADLKPVVIDFDIADVQFLTEQNLTRGGLGNMIFAAPEQLECAGDVDARADVFSLGRLLHFILIERVPSLKDTGDSLAGLSEIPPSLAYVVRKATQSRRDDRFPSVQHLLREAESYKTGWSACRANVQRSLLWARKNLALLVLSLSGLSGAIYHAGQASIERERRSYLDRLAVSLEELQSKLSKAQDEHTRIKISLQDARSRLAELEQLDYRTLTREARKTVSEKRGALSEKIVTLEDKLVHAEDRLRDIQAQVRETHQMLAKLRDTDPAAGPPTTMDWAPPDLSHDSGTQGPRVSLPGESSDEEAQPPTRKTPLQKRRAKKPQRVRTIAERDAEVQAWLRSARGKWKNCRDGTTQRWTRPRLQFLVDANGKVTKTKLNVPSGELSAGVESCIKRAVTRKQFSAAEKETPHFDTLVLAESAP